jgi:peptide/nickel transport system substrate-binding protein
MDIDHRQLDAIRSNQGEIENHLVDELVAGRLSRREFLRRGTVVGLGLPVLGSILAACGSSSSSGGSGASGGSGGGSGATIRVGIVTPTASINPLTVADQGGLDMLGQTGEYLCLSGQTLNLSPVLASSWKADSSGTVWTFNIRQGVKFSDGTPLTADDVIYTFKLQCDTKSASNALSAFKGVLVPDGVVKVSDFTVSFHLEAPNGNFPYLCSSDNYNMIILPKGYDPTKWESSFIGTGPFVKTSYTPKIGAAFKRNPNYWGTKAIPANTQFTFYATQTPAVLALQAGSIDVVGQFSVQGGEALLNGGYNIINLKSSAHRQLSMRCDQKPFSDPRVRQAIALTLPRPEIVQSLFKGYAVVGNDSPFAPVFPSTDPSVPQRVQDLTKAKQLLSDAGYPNGFSTHLVTEQFLEIPLYAQIVKESAAKIGVNIDLTIESSSQYYGKAVYGQSDWLDATMSLVDYGHRSVPNVFLTAPLESTGTWNAAHFKNPAYDSLVKEYVAAVDLTSQLKIAGQIQSLLLNETPIIFSYFYNYLTATAKNVSGAFPTAIGHIFVNGANKA